MRIKNTALLSLYYCRFLQSQFALPEPPSEEEMRREAAGIERLMEVLSDTKEER